MQHLCSDSLSGTPTSLRALGHVKGRQGFSRCIELIHIIHRLCGSPSIPLSFNLAAVLPRRSTSRVSFVTESVKPPTTSRHRLGRGLPGYLILFAPHAFVHERQCQPRDLPSPSVFLLISTHFTATPGIPVSSAALQPCSPKCHSQVKPGDFTSGLQNRLRTLYAQ